MKGLITLIGLVILLVGGRCSDDSDSESAAPGMSQPREESSKADEEWYKNKIDEGDPADKAAEPATPELEKDDGYLIDD